MTNHEKGRLNDVLRPLGLKVCWACEQLVGLEDFNNAASRGDGKSPTCKECNARDGNVRYRANPTEYRARANKWAKDNPKRHRLKANKATAKFKKANPEVAQAHNAVHLAVLEGRLAKPMCCSRCGDDGAVEAHHESYAKAERLNVVWLCRACHTNLHVTERGLFTPKNERG